MAEVPLMQEWNTIVEEIQKTTTVNQSFGMSSSDVMPTLIQDVEDNFSHKYETKDKN